MKKYILTTALVLTSILVFGQTVTFENLESFDKITIEGGDVNQIEIAPFAMTKYKVKLEGISKENVDYSLSAGNLTIDLKGNDVGKIVVYNRYLKRLALENDPEILGAEYLGENGNYLITDLTTPLGVASNFDFPDIDIRIPQIDIPEFSIPAIHINEDMDFDFDFDENFDFNFKEHMSEEERENLKAEMKKVGEEMKLASKEVKEELKKVMKEVKEEMERIREEREN